MTDKIDTFLEKITAFHTAVKKQEAPPEPCPKGQEMIDGDCVPVAKSQEKTMTETKPPEAVEKKPEANPTPSPAVAPAPTAEVKPATPPAPAPNPETKAEIDQLRSDMKEQNAMLSAITEKVAGVVLNASVKDQAETLRSAIDNVNKLATSLRSAQPKPEVHVKVVPFQTDKPVDMTPGFRSGTATMDELAERYMHKWGIEVPKEEELELPAPKVEEDPVKAELASLKAESKAHSAAMKGIEDKLSGLIAALSAKPGAPVAPASPAAPVVPVLQPKKSESSEPNFEVVHWDSDMNKGKSFEERARLLQEKFGLKENA